MKIMPIMIANYLDYLLISEDNKFCAESCDSKAPYIKNNKCTTSCEDLLVDENKNCVEECPKYLPFIYKNESINSC